MPNYVKTQLFNYADSSIYPYAIIDSIRYDASIDTSIGQDALRKFLNDDYAGTLTPPRQLVNIDEFAGFKSTTDISINNVITRINNIDSSISDISTSLNTLDSNVDTLDSSIDSLNYTATGLDTSIYNLDASMALAGLGLSSVTSLYNMPYVSNTINATVSDVSVISFDISTNDLTKLKGRVFSIHITPTDDYVQILTNGVQRVGAIYYNMHSTRYLYEAKSGYSYILKLTVYSVNNNNVYVNIDVVENELADSNLYYKTFITKSTTNNTSYVFSQQYQSAADSPLYIGDVSVVRKALSASSEDTDSQLIFCDITGQHQYWLHSLYSTVVGNEKPYTYYSYLYSSHDYGKTFDAGNLIFEYGPSSSVPVFPIDGTCSKNGECVYISCYNNSNSNAIVYSNTSYGNGTFTDHSLINFSDGKDIKIVTDYTGKRVCCFLTGYSGNNSYNKMYVSNDYGTTFDKVINIQGPELSSKMYIASSWDLKTIYLLANSTTQTRYNLYTYKYADKHSGLIEYGISKDWTSTSQQIDVSVASSTSKEGININCNYDGSKYMIIQSPSWNNIGHSGTSHNGYVRYFCNGVSADSSWNTTDSYSGYFKNVNICSDVLGNNSFVSFSNIANVFSNIPINTFYNINNGVIADTYVKSQLFVDPSSNSTHLIMIAHSQI